MLVKCDRRRQSTVGLSSFLVDNFMWCKTWIYIARFFAYISTLRRGMFWEDSQKQKCCRKGCIKVSAVSCTSTVSARPPYVTCRCGRTVSWWLAAERRCCRDTVSETGVQFDVRYCRAVPSWHRRIIMQSFYLTHLGTSSRWRSACNSCVASQTAMLTFNVAVSSELYWF